MCLLMHRLACSDAFCWVDVAAAASLALCGNACNAGFCKGPIRQVVCFAALLAAKAARGDWAYGSHDIPSSYTPFPQRLHEQDHCLLCYLLCGLAGAVGGAKY